MTYIPDLRCVSDQACKDKAAELIPTRNKEAIQKDIASLVDEEFDRLEYDAGYFISSVAADRAEKFLERVLEGDDDAARALLGIKGSRYRDVGYEAGKPWASLIRGRIYETGGIRLRRQIVEANADLIRDERIADLESIVEGLAKQIRKQDAEIERLLRG